MNNKPIIMAIAMLSLILAARLFVFDADKLPAHTNEAVQSYRLPNGMQVRVLENHRAPVVVSQVWYKVGASYEPDGITGISHVLEHMMFKGTKEHGPGEFSRIIAANGGRENAFTGADYTAYFQRIAKDRLALCLELEADRMRNLVLDEDEFRKEIEVVKEERRMRTEDKPTALTLEQFNAVAYASNPYRHPIIGWMEDLNSLTIDDVRKWYKTWYAPNNATLVVAGDVDATEVFGLAKKYFGALPAEPLPAIKPRREVKQYGEKRLTVKAPARLPYLIMGYKAPVWPTHEDKQELYALEVLAGILDGGDSARLSRELVRGSQIAASASAGYGMESLHETLFSLSAVPNSDVKMAALEKALRDQVEALKTRPVSADELSRVKAQVVAANVYQRDSVFYQAMEVGMLETLGMPWRLRDDYVKNIEAVTAEAVQKVARKYLVDDHLTVAVLSPLPLEGRAQASMNASGGAIR